MNHSCYDPDDDSVSNPNPDTPDNPFRRRLLSAAVLGIGGTLAGAGMPLPAPNGCELTGITATPDGKTLFVNIQHPGETASERSDPTRPTAVSSWPGNQFKTATGGRPRSATLVITRQDGGPVSA